MSKLIISRMNDRIVTALSDGGDILQINFDSDTDQPMVGDIYLGRVQNVVKNIQAAFIELGKEQVGYLSLGESSMKLTPGQEILVQLMKEPIKTKAPVVSTELSLPGKYVVLAENSGRVAISNKITDSERKAALKQLLEPLCTTADHAKTSDEDILSTEYDLPGIGFIVRTNSERATDEDILTEARNLLKRYQLLRSQAVHRTCYSKLYSGDAVYLTTIRDTLSVDLTDIVTDQPDLYDNIKDFLQRYQPEDVSKLSLYQDKLLPLIKLHRLETVLERALNKRVWLRSGGYLVIEPTEALTVIDVNTGKYDGHKNMDETFFQTNREAAEEIAIQLRLRNLSGIILIDFIDMKEDEKKAKLLAELENHLKRDPVKTVLVDITKLGLVELTRKKVRRPLHEQVVIKNRVNM